LLGVLTDDSLTCSSQIRASRRWRGFGEGRLETSLRPLLIPQEYFIPPKARSIDSQESDGRYPPPRATRSAVNAYFNECVYVKAILEQVKSPDLSSEHRRRSHQLPCGLLILSRPFTS